MLVFRAVRQAVEDGMGLLVWGRLKRAPAGDYAFPFSMARMNAICDLPTPIGVDNVSAEIEAGSQRSAVEAEEIDGSAA